MTPKLKYGAIAGISALAVLATAADARHQWRKYAWAWDGTPIAVVIYDNTNGADWQGRAAAASVAWNESPSIDGSVTKISSNTECAFVTGQIHVCNDDYGAVGWLGLASISLSGNEITGGWTKVNDHYFNQPSYDSDIWRQLVMCQEIGHDYGLGHQNENFRTNTTDSCMEYTSTPTAIDMTPDAHDYEQLEAMYPTGAGDGGDGGDGGNGGPPSCRGKGCKQGSGFALGHTPSSWGSPIDFLPNGKPFVYERVLSNGTRIVTHVTWTIEAAEAGGHHHEGPRRHKGERVFPGEEDHTH